jgi:hypothetical protein
MARPGRHSVISMWSTSRNGPTLVSQSNAVPTPAVCSEVNRMATASSIQSTWVEMSSTAAHTSSGVASSTVETVRRDTGARYRCHGRRARPGQLGR